MTMTLARFAQRFEIRALGVAGHIFIVHSHGCPLFEQRIHKGLPVEDLQVVYAFTDTDVLDRDLELVGDADDDAALGGAVELGQREGVDLGGSSELLGLFDGILSS